MSVFELSVRVAFGRGHPEKQEDRRQPAAIAWFPGRFWLFGRVCVEVDVTDTILEVVVVGIWLKSQPVLESDRKRRYEVETSDLREEVFGLIVSLVDVYPDQACEVVGRGSKLPLVLAAFVEAFVGCGTSEIEREGDDEAGGCEEDGFDA